MRLAHQFQGKTVKGQSYRRAGRTVSAEPSGHTACYDYTRMYHGGTVALLPAAGPRYKVTSHTVSNVTNVTITHHYSY